MHSSKEAYPRGEARSKRYAVCVYVSRLLSRLLSRQLSSLLSTCTARSGMRLRVEATRIELHVSRPHALSVYVSRSAEV